MYISENGSENVIPENRRSSRCVPTFPFLPPLLHIHDGSSTQHQPQNSRKLGQMLAKRERNFFYWDDNECPDRNWSWSGVCLRVPLVSDYA